MVARGGRHRWPLLNARPTTPTTQENDITTSTLAAPTAAPALRNLYLARFGFAVVWAGLFAATGSDLGTAAVVLLVTYPAFDVVAAIVDTRSTARTGHPRALHANMAVSAVAAVALAVGAADDVPTTLRIWGAWAIVAGAIQLVVALSRRHEGGHWPMVVSGGLSVLVGATFIPTAAQSDPSVTGIVGYAALGGVFFLVSALRLRT